MKPSKWTPYFVIILIALQTVVTSSGSNSVTSDSTLSLNQSADYELPYANVSNVVIDGQIANDEYLGSATDPISGIEVYWEHNTTVLFIGMISPGTGWVAFGIGAGMSDSNMIIGGVNGASVYAWDTDSSGFSAPVNDTTLPGGTYDILEFDATEAAGETVFEFTIYLNTGDLLDNVVEVGETVTMFVGYAATSDDVNDIHTAHSSRWDVMIKGLVKDYPDFDTSIPLVTDSNVTVDGEISENEYLEAYEDPRTGITVYWEHDDTNYNMALEAPGTGWVAIGFGYFMRDSPMIFGGVANDQTYCYDMVGLGTYDVGLDTDHGGTDDIIACEASEEEGKTILEFTIPMDSGDSLDPSNEMDEVYEMMVGFHLSSDSTETIHTAKSQFTALIRPQTVSVEMFMDISAPTEVKFNDTFTYEIRLYDETGANFSGQNVEFFLQTALGDLILEVVETDENGVANLTYYDHHLIYSHQFGARFKQLVALPSGGELTVYLGVEKTAQIDFLEAPEEEEPFLKRYSREGLILLFWITGLIIWGSFSVSLYGIIQIFQDREKGEKKKSEEKSEKMEEKKEEMSSNE